MEPSIEKRGKFYHLRYTKADGKPTTVSTGCKGKAEAWEGAKEFLSELQSPSKVVIMSDVFDAWERMKVSEGGCINKIASHVRMLRREFGAMDPYHITEAVDAFVARRRQEVSEATVGREIQSLKAAINYAQKRVAGKLLPTPPPPIEFSVVYTKRTTTASDDDLRRLRESIQSEEDWFKIAFLLAITTGQRQAAILDLEVGRVDWAANHIDFRNLNLRGKRKGRALVKIADGFHATLKAACDASKSGFVIEKDGRPATKSMLHQRWVVVRARAGLDNLWWHDLRRTWATMAARDGVDMIQISKQLGHSSITITEQHYAHYHPDYMGKAQEHSNRMMQNFL